MSLGAIGQILAIALALLAIAIHPGAAQASNWIVETDMGVDDQISLVYLAKKAMASDSISIKAVLTQGNGLAHAGAAKNNAVRLLRLAGIPADDLPDVGTGSQYSLDGFHQYPAAWRYNNDNLSGVVIPNYQQSWQTQNQSSESLLKQHLLRSKQANEPISILSLGTFTNIAKVLHENPSLSSQISQIICMAGAINAPGNLRIHGFSEQAMNGLAEFNAWIDPIATKIVFESGIPIQLIPLDVTNNAPLTKNFLNRFQQETQGLAADTLNAWWQQNLESATGEYYNWDPLATAIAIDPSLIKQHKTMNIEVLAQTQAKPVDGDVIFGMQEDFDILNWKGQSRQFFNPQNAGHTQVKLTGHPVDVVLDADIERYENDLITTFVASSTR